MFLNRQKKITMFIKCQFMTVHIYQLSIIRYLWRILTRSYCIQNNLKPITVHILSDFMASQSGMVRTFTKLMLISSKMLTPLYQKKYKNLSLIRTNNLASLNLKNTLIISYSTTIIVVSKLLSKMISFLTIYKLLIWHCKYCIFVNTFISMISPGVQE